jgi:hypothetical protein
MYSGTLKSLLVAATALQLAAAAPFEERYAKDTCKKTTVLVLGAGMAGITASQSDSPYLRVAGSVAEFSFQCYLITVSPIS